MNQQIIKKLIPYSVLFVICPAVLGIVNSLNSSQVQIVKNQKDYAANSGKQLQNLVSASPTALASQDKSFTNVMKVPSGQFNYGGSTTWAPIRKIVDPKIEDSRQEFKMTYKNHPIGETPGSTTGIRMLLNNQLDFSVSSRPLKLEEKQKGLEQKEVAFDSIAIAVNPKLNLQELGLTIEQLKDIYTGKITNWKQLGGPDIKITPYTRHPEDGGTVEYFFDEVLKIKVEELGASVETVENTTLGLREVRDNLGGIYYASTPEVIEQCVVKSLPLKHTTEEKFISPYKPPLIPSEQCVRQKNKIKVNTFAIHNGEYPITRKLYVIIKQDNLAKKQAGEAYANLLLSKQGQELLENAGFVRLYGAK